jgi:replicative DNA helicase
MNHRIELEQTIIGECLVRNNYVNIAGYLRPQDFSTRTPFDHQDIFRKIESLYPLKSIDVLSVVQGMNCPGLAKYLSQCLATACSPYNLRNHILILLEYSLRDTLVHTLQQIQQRNIELSAKAAINEVLTSLTAEDIDILDSVEFIEEYLSRITDEPLVLNDIKTLRLAFVNRLSKIQTSAHLDSLIGNFQAIGGYLLDPQTKAALFEVKKRLINILVSGKDC